MATTPERRERVVRHVEFRVAAPWPQGACWTDVMAAIQAAHRELWDANRVERDHDAPVDAIRIRPGDDDVIVAYEIEERP